MSEPKTREDVLDSTARSSATLSGNGPDRASRPAQERALTTSMQDAARERSSMSSRAEAVGRELARYGLAVVVGWIGLMKFTTYEAEGISPFVAHSPLMSWVYGFMSVRGFSAVLGVIEVAIAILIAARPLSPRASVLGSALAVGMFLTTLSFLVTTPGVWEPSAGGFPALSALPGQFLIKDLALLGIALWTLGEAWKAIERRSRV
jgi:reactive chlorine resistance protein C